MGLLIAFFGGYQLGLKVRRLAIAVFAAVLLGILASFADAFAIAALTEDSLAAPSGAARSLMLGFLWYPIACLIALAFARTRNAPRGAVERFARVALSVLAVLAAFSQLVGRFAPGAPSASDQPKYPPVSEQLSRPSA